MNWKLISMAIKKKMFSEDVVNNNVLRVTLKTDSSKDLKQVDLNRE
ncbi:hypothetical protein HYE37_00850 [Mycoplasmopsis bovis]|nr:hypothetical protein [Mycoplasmopsis bovis]QQH21254.1 hypothetical protein HYE37_00850 [Mycoplasmopsis bovis]